MMKRFILLILTLLSFCALGQTSLYKPFPSKNGNWVYRYYDDYNLPTSQETQYLLKGDTIISSRTYKKVYLFSSYKGALREANKIIYFIPDTSLTEFELYNFNLKIGDKIIHPYGGASCSNDTVTVNYIDSVLASDGYHKQYHLSSFALWIEGIGSLNYFLKPSEVLCVSGNDRLECMINDVQFNFPPSSSNCSPTGLQKNNSNLNISVFPNPSNGSITVKCNDQKISQIIIMDFLGNTVQYETVSMKEMSINNLKTGIYYLIAIDQKGQQTKIKIISCP